MTDIVDQLAFVIKYGKLHAIPQEVVSRAAAEITRLRAENERLSKAMTDLLWYVAQLETLAYDKDDAGEHESVTRARAALKENNDE